MSTPIVKYAAEEIPLIFFFNDRLGPLAPGARITEVLELTVAPTGDENDLEIGAVDDAVIDEVTELAVQVRAINGREGLYRPRCTALVVHAGATYPLVVELLVYVRA